LVAVFIGISGCQPKQKYPGAYEGIVEFDERVLGFEVGGRVLQVAVDRGDTVKAKERLATLDDSLERTARESRAAEASAASAQVSLLKAGSRPEEIRSVAAQVRAARASEALLDKNAKRERGLLKKGVSTQSALDQIEARLSEATAQRQSLQHRLQALREGARKQEIQGAEAKATAADKAVSLEDDRIRRYELHALAGGTVLDVHVEPGEVVAPGSPVVTVADTHHPYADVFVPQGKLDGLRVGDKASVHVDSLSGALGGHVEDIARRTEFTPRFLFSERERPNLVVRVRVRIDDPEQRLHAGVPAFVDITRGQPAK
jgi:HlyD family secretion protein